MRSLESPPDSAASQESERFATPLGDTIRQIRLTKNLTLEKLAADSGLTKQAVRRIETGAVANASIGSLVSIAEALGLRVGVLLFLAERGVGKDPSLVGHEVEARLPDLGLRPDGAASHRQRFSVDAKHAVGEQERW